MPTLSPSSPRDAEPVTRCSASPAASDIPVAPPAASINLVLLTVRDNLLAREIIGAAMRATVSYPGVRLSLAYGGVDAAHREWLAAQCAATQAQGGEVRLMQHPDIQRRLQWAMASPQDWVLFLSDDDAFSVNYIGSLVRRAATVGPEVAIVAPMLYVGVTAGHTKTRRVEPVSGQVADRLEKFAARADLTGLLYYALHRRETVRDSFEQLAKMPHTPSYFDQLLTTRSILQGELAVTDESSMLVYDESNWVGVDACARSDARFYPQPAMVLFHELLWTADMIRLFRPHPEFGVLQEGLMQWMRTVLTRQFHTFERRCDVLGIVVDAEVAEMLQAVVTVVKWLHDVKPGEAFAAGLSSVEALAAEIQRTLLQRAAVASAGDTARQLAREEMPA